MKETCRILFSLLIVHLGLLFPPLRFPASLFLLGFLPGYVLVETLALWSGSFSAAVGSVGLSLLLSPLLVTIGSLVIQRFEVWVILLSLDVYFVMLLLFRKKQGPVVYEEDPVGRIIGPLLFVILGAVGFYLDLTGLGPYCDDWTYLHGVIKEISRNMPPLDPEASDWPLRYPWVFYTFYAALHQLGAVTVWRVLETIPVMTGFAFLGIICLILTRLVPEKEAAVWVIAFLVLGRETGWVVKGMMGGGWEPFYPFENWLALQVHSVYAFLWGGWYLLPSLIPFLFVIYFLIRYGKEGKPKDFFLSLGICAVGCLFHPAYYLFFMIGFWGWTTSLWLKKGFSRFPLWFLLTPLPYLCTFYLFGGGQHLDNSAFSNPYGG